MNSNYSIVNKSGLRVLEVDCSSKSIVALDKECEKKEFKDALLKHEPDMIAFMGVRFSRVYTRDEISAPKNAKGRLIPRFVSYVFGNAHGSVLEEYPIPGATVRIIKTHELAPTYVIEPVECTLSMKDIESAHTAFDSRVEEEFGRGKKQVRLDSAPLQDVVSRYSDGFGVLELFFRDEKLQDVFVDSPAQSPIHVLHEQYGECNTNVYVGDEELEKIASKLRIMSGRPFDAAHPVFNASLDEYGVRVSGICEPLTFSGIAFAFRKRTTKPFTLAGLVQNKTLSARTAALLSLLVEGESAILITGARGAGKTSLLNALLLEVPKHYRAIVIEDTAELPVSQLRALGFKIQHVRTKATTKENNYELSAQDAVHSALRLGESALVVGEVRGGEARALFEAMRIGAAGRVVLGTIHGSGARDTFERVVHDLGVPQSSFKATDVVVSLASLQKTGSLEKTRKVVGITEVGKDWTQTPMEESGFITLGVYAGEVFSVRNLTNSSILKRIAFSKQTNVSELLRHITCGAVFYEMLAQKNIIDMVRFLELKTRFNPIKQEIARSNTKNYAKLAKNELSKILKQYET